MHKPGLSSVTEALAQLLADAGSVVETETLPLRSASGRILAASARSTLDVPPGDNSSMDGYALRQQDVLAGQRDFPVSQRIAAGAVGTPLQARTAARIFTGAELPAGADCVVMQEDCTAFAGGVTINQTPEAGANIRRRGQDIALGSAVVEAGTRLDAAHVGLLAAIGLSELVVWRTLRVAILATGDELVEPGQPLQPGQIYNSNRYLLAGLLEALGAEVIDCGMVPDTLQDTRNCLRRAAAEADLVITTGGVSVGEEDHVKPAVEELGTLRLWKIAIKPGKPLAYGRILGKPFLGLPGNPSSVFVTFTVFARPYVQRMQGMRGDLAPLMVSAIADFDWPRPGTRQEYLRARLHNAPDGAHVGLYPNQSSGVLASVAWANCLVVLKPGDIVAAGNVVKIFLL